MMSINHANDMTNDHLDANRGPEEERHEGKTPTEKEIGEIRDIYLKTLEIPDEKRTPQILLCPIGLVGAGKTTVMKPLCERLRLVRISTDNIRMLLRARGFNYVPTPLIAKGIVEQYLTEGYGVGLDMDCVGSVKSFVEETTKATPIRVVWIHINPPKSYILNKFHHLKYGLLLKDEADAIACYERRKPLHAHLEMPFVYTFDPSRDDLSAQIEEAAGMIERAR
jgi:hypothetical protein